MKSSQFLQALRKIIREEVQNAVRTELNNIGMISERKDVKQYSYTESYKPKASAKKQFVKDSLLNDILNETAGHNSSAYGYETDYNDFSEWPTMNINSMNGYMQPRQMRQNALPITTDINGNRINTEQLAQTEAGAAVVNALTKDYSALMKAIDKKKGK